MFSPVIKVGRVWFVSYIMERPVVIRIEERVEQDLLVFCRRGKMVVITRDDIYLVEESTGCTPKRKVPPPDVLEEVRRQRHRVRRKLDF